MVLKYISILIIPAFISAVYNSKMKTNEPSLSEISKNITEVNNMLQDLIKKYTLLKNGSHVKEKTIQKKEKKFNESYKEKTDIETRGKVKIKEPQKFYGTTLFFTDQSGDDSGSDLSEKGVVFDNETVKDNKRFTDPSIKIDNPREFEGIGTFISDHSSENQKDKRNYQARNKKKVLRIKDGASEDSRENSFERKDSRVETEKIINIPEQNLQNKKITTLKDYFGDEVVKIKSKDNLETKDVHKILVIHLGGKEYLENKRASSQKEVVTRTTMKQQIPTRSIAFRSVTADDTNSDLEEETAMKEDILRANSLREALGDACTKLVNKKCKNKVMAMNNVTMVGMQPEGDPFSWLFDLSIATLTISVQINVANFVSYLGSSIHDIENRCYLEVKTALKAVLKDVCKKDRKCKSEFNDDFTENSISACNEQFSDSKKRKLYKKRSNHDKQFQVDNYSDDFDADENSNTEDENLTGVQFIDYTRQGIDMTCLHAISGFKEPKTTQRTNLTEIDSKTKNVHILRDKLEDACRKSCFDKCNKACKCVTDKTCKIHECISAKTRALSSSCKRRCQESYQYKGKGASDSESESDSDEDSDKEDSD